MADQRIRFIAQGQVQGVGFRPFIWRLARELGLSGHVANTSAGVVVEVQGPESSLAAFAGRLENELPPLARITRLEREELPILPVSAPFAIHESRGHAGQNVLVSPDVAVCGACLADVRDPSNFRYGYAFANCTDCGPRFSITSSIPYDRRATTMACFPMCASCGAEYADPADRRFHAQPIACSDCGPQVWFVTEADRQARRTAKDSVNSRDVIARAGLALLAGQLVAIRGLGGFQLACDARNHEAVARLRQRKWRPHKALAVMSRNPDETCTFCKVAPQASELLSSPAAPIVLCDKIPSPISPLADNIAPDVGAIGVMLPSTPLHALLLDWLAANGMPSPVLVMTSANPPGEPICLGNREALARLSGLADAWLLHNRDILCRVDDSVVACSVSGPIFLRRSRGYVPLPVRINSDGPCALGVGAELKATFCLTRGDNAFLGQHIGDLKSPSTSAFYTQALGHLQRLLEVEPVVVVCDLHPDFVSSHFARQLGAERNIPVVKLQHHVAHAMACLAENGVGEASIAICLDGSGLGTDGTIWGGEILWVDPRQTQWRRVAHLAPFPLPGGEQAIREPWRIATALAWQNGRFSPCAKAEAIILEMLDRGFNCPMTSSCGRLFDAVAALTGICPAITYEGQAAVRLETAACQWLSSHGAPDAGNGSDYLSNGMLDSQKLFAQAAALAKSMAPQAVAAWFHSALALALANLASAAARRHGVSQIALTGGVMQNRLLESLLTDHLKAAGLQPLTHRWTPPGDGGVAMGQAVWGRSLAASGQLRI